MRSQIAEFGVYGQTIHTFLYASDTRKRYIHMYYSAAKACVLTFQAFQLFSSSVQFCGRSRLPCPCRPERHKRNTCEPASVSCSLCRNILPCRQVHRVTNIYVLSFCVSSYMFGFLRGGVPRSFFMP